MKRWIGRAIIVVGLLHTVFGLITFRQILAVLLHEGLINTVNMQPEREMAFWFIYCGFFMLILGALVDYCESKGVRLPRAIGWGLLAVSLVGVIVMPVSGFWLFFIPALGAVGRKSASAM